MTTKNKETRMKTLPLLALRGLVVFPGTIIHFDVGRPQSVKALYSAMDDDQILFLVSQKDSSIENPLPEDMHSTGVVSRVLQVMKLPDDKIRVVAEGLYRAEGLAVVQVEPHYLIQTLEKKERNVSNEDKKVALERELRAQYAEYSKQSPLPTAEVDSQVNKATTLNELCDCIANALPISTESKQSILDMITVSRRAETVLKLLNHEQQILNIELAIQKKVQERLDENQKDFYLREQIRAICDELGEEDNPLEEAEEYRSKIQNLNLEESTLEKLYKECNKLAKMPYGSQEATVVRCYLDACLSLPWNKRTEDIKDLKKSKEILDAAHFGLKETKERILEILAVRQLSNDAKGQILCLVGPPGVGKTSVARSMADAMGRKYVRISLGGVRDEADIRGHRRTYIGSMMGRIMDAIVKSESSNPLILLDEVDKLGNDYRGDPAAALLEVLDTEQNCRFIDHYLDIPFDLSEVLFVTTANDVSTIPAPLLDRMDILMLDGYTEQEKIHIAKDHLIKKQIKANGLTAKQFSISEAVLKTIIERYTKEAGVRNLERMIAKLCRKIALQIVEDKKSLKITKRNLKDLLGPEKYKEDYFSTNDQIGIANGLAWTGAGGEVLPIEVSLMEGTGKIELTGSLGDVIKESAKVAVSCARTYACELGMDKDFYKKYDIHIHAPEGAVPKDGPSAGITILTSLLSALLNKPIDHTVAMTGEITLRGMVLPIGGLKEKAMAAYAYGMKTLVIPDGNFSDIEEIDEEIKKSLIIKPVKDYRDVLEIVLK